MVNIIKRLLIIVKDVLEGTESAIVVEVVDSC